MGLKSVVRQSNRRVSEENINEDNRLGTKATGFGSIHGSMAQKNECWRMKNLGAEKKRREKRSTSVKSR
jgi:hypothetical protein